MVVLGDGIQGLCALPKGSVSLVCSDLPSGETQAEFDTRPSLTALWPAIWHALDPAGAVVLMASSIRFAAALISSQPDQFRYDLIWRKSLASGHLNANKRPLRAHEFILVFGRCAVYRPQMTQGHGPIHAATRTSNGENYGVSVPTKSRAGATTRYPVSVLEIPGVGTSAKTRVHPQQKPEQLLRWIIRTYTVEGSLIVDPFAGSGSCGVAAVAEGRKFLGWDSDPRFGK